MKNVAVIGAGGKMGYRVSANLRDAPYKVSHVEVSAKFSSFPRSSAHTIACLALRPPK